MLCRRLDQMVTLLLLAVLLTTALSGLLADYLGIPRSLYHRLSAYSLVTLASWHIVLRRRQIWLRLVSATGVRCTRESASAPGAGLAERVRVPLPSRRVFLASGLAGLAGFWLGRWLPLGKTPPELAEADLGLAYHQWSKPGLEAILRKPFQWGAQPALYKEYPSAPRIILPGDFQYRGLYVEEAIQQRRSVRDYTGKAVSLSQLSLLLHSAYGVTEPSYPLRASPSAGGLYPLEVYPVVNRVEGLARGVYHYRPGDHALDLIEEGDFRNSLLVSTGGQDMVLHAGVVLVITAIFQRTHWKYQERAYRYVLLDAGHLGENLYLAATSMGLGACGIGAFLDDAVNRLVAIDGKDEAALYLVSIGTRT